MILLYQEVVSIVSDIEFDRFYIVLGFSSIVLAYGILLIA